MVFEDKFCFEENSVLKRNNFPIDLGNNSLIGLKCVGNGELETCSYNCDIEYFPNSENGPIVNIGNLDVLEGSLFNNPESGKELLRKKPELEEKILNQNLIGPHPNLNELMKLIKTELYSADDLSGTLKTNNYGKREMKTVIIYRIQIDNIIDSMTKYSDNKFSMLIKKKLLEKLSDLFKENGVDRLILINSDYEVEWNNVLNQLGFSNLNKYKYVNYKHSVGSLSVSKSNKSLPKRIYLKILNPNKYQTFRKEIPKNTLHINKGGRIIKLVKNTRKTRKSRNNRSYRKLKNNKISLKSNKKRKSNIKRKSNKKGH